MSDGMRDATVVGELGSRVERCAADLVRAMWVARGGHRGIAIDELTTVNEQLGLYGLRVVTDHDYERRIERAAELQRWSREENERRAARAIVDQVRKEADLAGPHECSDPTCALCVLRRLLIAYDRTK